MAVALSSLRITSDFDASRYVAGMSAKVSADNAGIESSKAAGAAVEGLTIKVSSAVPLIERLSRTYIDGYGSAAKFNTELLRLARSQDTTASSSAQLELIYSGLQRKFGLMADASDLAARGYVSLAGAIETVNSRLSEQTEAAGAASAIAARMEQLRQAFDPAYVSAQRLSAELGDLAEAERLGVQITGGYENALSNIIVKHDAVAAAAKRQADEYRQLAQAGRDAYAAEQAQSSFNTTMGVGSSTGLRAADSAAVFSDQLSKLEEIARLQAQQQAANFSSDLNSSFNFGGNGTSAKDSAAVFSTQFQQLEELQRQIAQQNGANFTSDLNDRLGVNGYGTSAKASASAFEEAARAAEDMDKQVSVLRAQIDPLSAAQARLNSELALYDSLLQKSAISSAEAAKAQVMSRQRYDAAEKEIQRQNKKGLGGLPGYQATNLMYQGTDVVQSLALGMPVSQVLLQQGPQIARIFAADSAAMKGLIGSLGASTAVVAGVVVAIGVAAKAWNDYLTSIKAVETAASGVGRAVSGTASDMEASALAGAAAANISVKAARAMEAQFLQTGKIGSENYAKLIGVSKDFATTIGADSSTIGQTLAQMFADPATAAQTLSRQYGLIDANTAEYASNLAAQNRLSDAQGVLLDALPGRLAHAAEATTLLGRAWEHTGNAAAAAYDWIGKTIDKAVSGPTLQDQMASARQRLQAGQDAMQRPAWLRPSESAVTEPLNTLNTLGPQLRRQQEQDALTREFARRNQQGVVATGIADQSPANARMMQIQELQNTIASLEAQRSGTNPEQDDRINAALASKTSLLSALEHQQQRLSAIDQLDIQIQNERNPLIKAQLTEQREKISLSLQEGNVTEKNLEAQRAGNTVINAAIASGAAQAKDMQTEIGIRQRLNAQVASGSLVSVDAQAQLEKELAVRPLVEAAAAAEGARKKQLLEVIKQLSDGYDGLAAAQKQSAANDFIRSQTDSLASLKSQQSVLGENEATQSRIAAQLAAEQKIRDMGLATTSAEAQAIRNNATAIADMTSALDKSKDAWNTYRQAGESAVDSIFDGVAAGNKASDIGKSLITSIGKAAVQLAAENPIKNALFGTNLGTLDDLFKGKSNILSSVGGQTVGSMTVNAATVMVNGGVAGSAGGLLGGGSSAASLVASNSNIPTTDIAAYIRQAATQRGIDPTTALQVAQSEGGLSSWNLQSGVIKNGMQEPSFGPYQLYMNGGLGNQFMKQTGLNPADASSGPAGVDYALDYAKKNGWGSWYGAKNSGISNWQGINSGTGTAATDASKSLSDLNSTAKQATGSVGKLGSATGTAANGLDSLGGGLGKFGQALSTAQSGGNTGLVSLLGSLTGFGQSVFNTSGQFSSAILSGGLGLYDDGGYTGPGAKHQVAGYVHRGEVVFSQSDVARLGGLGNVEAIRSGKFGYESGGTVGDVRAPVKNSIARGGSNDNQSSRSTKVISDVRVSFDPDEGFRAYVRGVSQQEGDAAADRKINDYDYAFPDRIEAYNRNPRSRG